MAEDRRTYPRKEIDLAAVQIAGAKRIERRVTSLSAGGLLLAPLATGEPLSEAAPVVLELGEGEEKVKLTGDVAYIDATGVGVRITRADWAAVNALLAEREIDGAADGGSGEAE